MTGFNKMAFRKTRIFGTHGELYGNGKSIKHFNFLNDRTETIPVYVSDDPLLSGHGGGDDILMESFLTAILTGNSKKILSTPQDTLESYLMVFAAENSRRHKKVVDLNY
jgi:hypothetical protein